LIRHRNGNFWAFPKGHAEQDESPLEAATRELKEETGLEIVRLLAPQTLQESYYFTYHHKRIHKTVIYFLAEVIGEVQLCPLEVEESQWVKLTEAHHYATFPEGQALCRQTAKIVYETE
jgi:bis(5'-nucleosidyl)-tetraphosphatase